MQRRCLAPMFFALAVAAGPARADCTQIVGTWEWQNGYVYAFTEDGRWEVINGAFVGDWICGLNEDGDPVVDIVPDAATWSARVLIAPDGKSLLGEMGSGFEVEAVPFIEKK